MPTSNTGSLNPEKLKSSWPSSARSERLILRPPPRVAVTTSLNVDIFDAMMARASSEGITSRSGALHAAVREWVRDVERQPEAHQD